MTALDGTSQPQASTTSASTAIKRKRTDDLDHAKTNGKVPDNEHIDSQSSASTTSSVAVLLDVLSSYDSTTSILQRPLLDDPSENASKAPDTKRPKISETPESMSIQDRARHNRYSSTTQLFSDVERASSQALEDLQNIQTPEGNFLHKYTPELVEADRMSAEVEVFRKVAANLRAQEKDEKPGMPETFMKPIVNGDLAAEEDSLRVDVSDVGGKKVLTLYGNAQGHKQLFSSSQKPLGRSERQHCSTEMPDASRSLQVPMPLREDKLPQQIFSSQIVATDTQDALPKARQRLQFGDLFKPASSLKPLVPPKHPKCSTSRASEITWTMDDSASRAVKSGYAHEKLPTGAWLGYNSVSLAQEPISPEAKRKRRDRALSSGEPAVDQTLNLKVAQAQAKEEALFRGAYSSFAPCIDDSGALVPEEVRSEVWWHRYGDNSLNAASWSDPGFDDAEDLNEILGKAATETEEQAFKDVVDSYDPALFETEMVYEQKPDPNDVEKTLQKISQLLESLLSFQRIRTATLRSNIGQSTSTQDTPAIPTADEVKLYVTSRTRLADLVTKLPPYAIAKAGGQQLSDLLVSREILVEGRNYQGVMEEDQASRKAAGEALSNALGPASARPTTTSRASNTAIARKPPAPAYNSTRPTPASHRQPLSSWQTPAQSGASAAQRSSYGQTPSYNRSLTSGYKPGGPQVNGAAPSNYAQTPSQPQYQQRAQYNPGQGYGAGYNATNPYSRNATPMQNGPQYQPNMTRPGSSGYYNNESASGPVPQAPMTSPRAPMRPPSGQQAHSPMGAGSPYAPPASIRPVTPSTPAQATMSRPASGAGSPSKPLEKPLVNGT